MFEYNKIVSDINSEWFEFINQNRYEIIEIIDKLNNLNYQIYPKQDNIFETLKYFGPIEIKLVILAQDPYINHENNIPQACGLAFSIPSSHKKIPPSLKTIFKEIKNSYPNYNIPSHGCLKNWVENEKILLLNSSLTVKAGVSNSHYKIWYKLTDRLIRFISDINPNTIFLLMGNFAKKKSIFIDQNKHKIFFTAHPSPLSNKKFLGSNVFLQINDYLISQNKSIINY
jgi:uracil-DNA glycosylase